MTNSLARRSFRWRGARRSTLGKLALRVLTADRLGAFLLGALDELTVGVAALGRGEARGGGHRQSSSGQNERTKHYILLLIVSGRMLHLSIAAGK